MALNQEQLDAFGVGASCDRCGVDPLVKYRNEGLDLEFLFCGHHSNKSEQALLEKGFTMVVDLRDDAGRALRPGGEPEAAPLLQG